MDGRLLTDKQTDKQTNRQTNGTENITSFDFVGGGNNTIEYIMIIRLFTIFLKAKLLRVSQRKKLI